MCLYLLNGGGGGGGGGETLARFLLSGILKNLMARFDNNNNQILKHIVASSEKKFAQCLGAGVAMWLFSGKGTLGAVVINHKSREEGCQCAIRRNPA